MEADSRNKLREETGVDKVSFQITLVKSKNKNSRGDLKAWWAGGYLFILIQY